MQCGGRRHHCAWYRGCCECERRWWPTAGTFEFHSNHRHRQCFGHQRKHYRQPAPDHGDSHLYERTIQKSLLFAKCIYFKLLVEMRRHRMKHEKGFTLVEVLVSVPLMLVILAATLSTLTSAIHATEAITLMADTQENLRAGLNYMVRDFQIGRA